MPPTKSPADLAAQVWLEMEAERAEKVRHIEREAQELVGRLHREYFEPFDFLLEKKAEYALKQEAEKGEIPPWLLREIEILDKFRGYVERLENIQDEMIMSHFVVLNRFIQDYRHKWQEVCKYLDETDWLLKTVWNHYGPDRMKKPTKKKKFTQRRRAGTAEKRIKRK